VLVAFALAGESNGVALASTSPPSSITFTVDDISTEPPGSVAMINEEINFTLIYTDPGIFSGNYTIDWDWGDGTSSSWIHDSVLCPIDEIEQLTVCTVTGSHTYVAADPNVYTVGVVVTAKEDDEDDRSSKPVSLFVVTYDPNAGFVTGGGWIDSPPGACDFGDYCTENTIGKASFGFVSKYKKGKSTPDGNTEFQFKAGDLNFHSDSHDWLVIAGHKAMYKGTGTINGSGDYGFLLSAIDAKLTPSTDVDLFRIQIKDKDNGDAVVYDNMMGKDENADPTTAIGGGSIVIHKGK
jgi:hypothetical protein